MGWNQFTSPLAIQDIYHPLSEESIMMGAKANYDRAAKVGQNLSTYRSKLFGQNVPGKDGEVLADYERQFNENVQDLVKQGVDSPEKLSRINSLITNFTSNPDILAINKRINFFNSESEKEQKAAEKGEIYRSKGKKDLDNYYNSGVYQTTPIVNFTNGYITPQISKLQQDLLKNNKEEIYRKDMKFNPSTGNYEIYNKVDGKKAGEQWYNSLATDPELNTYYRDKFEEEYADYDWDTQAKDLLLNAHNNSLQLAQAALDSGNPEMAAFYENKAKSQLNAANNNQYSASQIKEKMFDDYLREDAEKFGSSINVLDIKDIQEDAYKLEQFKTGQDLYKNKEIELFKAQTDLFPHLTKDEQDVFLGNKKGTIDWSAASTKLTQQKNKQSIEGKLDDWQAKKDYEASLKNWQDSQENINAFISYGNKANTENNQDKANLGKSSIISNISEIKPFIKKYLDFSKSESAFRPTLSEKDFADRRYTDIKEDGDNYILSSPDKTFGGDLIISKNSFNKAVQDWKNSIPKPEYSNQDEQIDVGI